VGSGGGGGVGTFQADRVAFLCVVLPILYLMDRVWGSLRGDQLGVTLSRPASATRGIPYAAGGCDSGFRVCGEEDVVCCRINFDSFLREERHPQYSFRVHEWGDKEVRGSFRGPIL